MSEMFASRDDVVHAYRLMLGRDPDPAGLDHYATLVESSRIPVEQLFWMFALSPEFKARVGVISPRKKPEGAERLHCAACTEAMIASAPFRYWSVRMGVRPGLLRRKTWEWCFISQALHERGMLAPGNRGLGFAVGTEPLTALFASIGCEILATDLDATAADREGWIEAHQHAAALADLNASLLCPSELFEANVRFRSVDMRAIPADIGSFDFLWSSCALEHLGSIDRGLDFIRASLDRLKPGGVAVHTTEINVESNTETIEVGHDVIFRRVDLERLRVELSSAGHEMEPLTFDFGGSQADRYVDEPPYRVEPHLKLRIGPFASTSYGIVIRKSYSSP